jgi:hypothetical protein
VAHFNLIRNPVTNWTTGSGVVLSEIQAFDQNLASVINGTDGGCWAPTSHLAMSGAGLQVTGPSVVTRGGTLQTNTIGTFVLADNDYPQLSPLHSGRSRTIQYSCADGKPINKVAWWARWSDAGMQSVAPVMDFSDGNGPAPARLWVRIRGHNGATLSGVTVNFRIGWPHTSLPSARPSARMVRVDSSGNLTPMTSIAAGGDANGYVSTPAVTTVSKWSGQQTIPIVCDQANALDLSQYSYYCEIVEESGLTSYPWSLVVKQPVKWAVTQNDAYFPLFNLTNTIDGSASQTDGDRVLVNANWQGGPGNQFVFTRNGIWTIHAGTWHRAGDLFQASQYTPGMIVPVQQGSLFGGTYWQASPKYPSWATGTPDDVHYWSTGTDTSTLDHPVNIVPSAAHWTGFWYQQTGSDGLTSATTEPKWPTDIGTSVADNTVTWKCMGTTDGPLQFIQRGSGDNDTQNGGLLTILRTGLNMFPHGNIFQSVTASFTGITQAGFA